MNVLSLFDGISCGRVALERAGIPVEKYYASEIDKYAIQVSRANYPDIVQLGDINLISDWQLPKIDLVIGGSPCQSFSVAGNGKGFEGKSGLFWEFARLVKECRPKHFLLENVVMKKEWQDVISKELGVEPIKINSALVSAQQRKRLYWTNIPNVEQPEDKGIYLKDILESGEQITEKAYTLTVKGLEGLTIKGFNHYLKKKKDNFIIDDSMKFKNIRIGGSEETVRIGQIGKGGQGQRIYDINGKSICLSALGGGQGAKTGLYNIPHGYIKEKIQGHEKYPTLCNQSPASKHLLLEKDCVRKLTPIECERLQTLPDNYTSCVSNTRRYMGIGNGWTVDIICWILGGLKL